MTAGIRLQKLMAVRAEIRVSPCSLFTQPLHTQLSKVLLPARASREMRRVDRDAKLAGIREEVQSRVNSALAVALAAAANGSIAALRNSSTVQRPHLRPVPEAAAARGRRGAAVPVPPARRGGHHRRREPESVEGDGAHRRRPPQRQRRHAAAAAARADRDVLGSARRHRPRRPAGRLHPFLPVAIHVGAILVGAAAARLDDFRLRSTRTHTR